MVYKAIRDLALYGVRTGLITEADVPYVINRLIDEMKLDAYEEPTGEAETDLETILAVLLEDACKRELIPDSIVYKDLFDTKLMGVMTPFPREVIGKFRELHAETRKKQQTGIMTLAVIQTTSADTASKRICVGKP